MIAAVRGWWDRRTLQDRLALLVSVAVATAVVTVAVAAWLVVAEIQQQRTRSALAAEATAIAAAPDQWLGAGPPPRADGERGGRRRPHQFGPRWQVLNSGATVITPAAVPLPVTSRARDVAAGRSSGAQEEIRVGDDSYLMLTMPVTEGGAVQVAIDRGPDNQTLTIFGVLLAVGCIVGVAGATLLGRAVARAGLTPVRRIAAAVEEVAVTMDLSRPIAVSGTDDLARLGTSVNTMLAAIDTSRRQQRTLVEDAGHELRTPLTSLRTNIELLLEVEHKPELAHRLPPDERVKLLADLEAQVGELSTLTTELVELSREETTREAPESVEFTEVVETALSRVRMRAPSVTFAADLFPATVVGRPAELERMVVNILDNAAKWSPPGGTVTTRVHVDGDDCVLTVGDDGPGIDEADRPHVFDRFYRALAARSTPGSGLGLAIVAQTATHHGGTVTTAPADPHGTVVTVRLPIRSP